MNAQLTKTEIDVVLDWYDYATSSTFHYGGAAVAFPSEVLLLKKLKNSPEPIDLNIEELELISDMMQKSVSRKFGSAKYLFGFEQQLYIKINTLLSKLKERG